LALITERSATFSRHNFLKLIHNPNENAIQTIVSFGNAHLDRNCNLEVQTGSNRTKRPFEAFNAKQRNVLAKCLSLVTGITKENQNFKCNCNQRLKLQQQVQLRA